MNSKNNDVLKLCFLIVLLIVVIIISAILNNNSKKQEKNQQAEQNAYIEAMQTGNFNNVNITYENDSPFGYMNIEQPDEDYDWSEDNDLE